MPPKLILCRCEDVTSTEVERAVAAGYADLEEVKRYTGFGTGPCQGKECLRAVAVAILAARGALAAESPPLEPGQPSRALEPLQPFTARPPLAPTALKRFAAARATTPASTATAAPESQRTEAPVGGERER